jgi:hypothetical protein
MAKNTRIDSLRGKNVRWTFTDGPTAGTTYEHTFREDGKIGFRGADTGAKADFTWAKDGTVATIGDGRFVVSYLADGGFTLTVVLNTNDGTMVGFASNNESWFQQKGTFELASPSRQS